MIAFLAALAGALRWPLAKRLLAPLVSAGVAMLCLIITFGQTSSQHTPIVSLGRSIWFYLAVIAMGLATFQAYQRWVEGKMAPVEPTPPPPPPPS